MTLRQENNRLQEQAADWQAEVARLRDQVARLRVALKTDHRKNYTVHGLPGKDDAWNLHITEERDCEVCALLAEPAPEGQRAGAEPDGSAMLWTARRWISNAPHWRNCSPRASCTCGKSQLLEDLSAAVEAARQEGRG